MSLVLPSLMGANKPASGSAFISNTLSASFDGTDDVLNCTIPVSLMASAFTTSIWVRLVGQTGLITAPDGAFWGNNYNIAGKIGWRLYFDANSSTNGGIFSVWATNAAGQLDNPVAAVQSSVVLGDQTWAHIVWGRDSSTHFLYVNGTQQTVSQGAYNEFDSYSVSFSDTAPDLKINPDISNGPCQGEFDEAAIWDSVLTSAQISNIYRGETNGGSGGTNGTAGDLSSFSPEIWWRMGDGTGDTNSSGGTPANGGTVGTILNQGSLASSNSAVGANGTLFSNSAP